MKKCYSEVSGPRSTTPEGALSMTCVSDDDVTVSHHAHLPLPSPQQSSSPTLHTGIQHFPRTCPAGRFIAPIPIPYYLAPWRSLPSL
ncbi:hypothetical protein J6590_001430 [Homalodisca vitripennis]|nr:hypothetical protein J6590_001430 [Homalodisca vitripennis]